MEKLQTVLNAALADYNESHATMELVLFHDAVSHVARIARIIMSPGGHALLVGVGGSGKQSLARLAAHVCELSVQTLQVSAQYTMTDFRDELKSMCYKAGVKDEQVMLLLRDSNIIHEQMLVHVNDLMASGYVPELYAPEDRDTIVNEVAGKVKAAGLSQDRDSCWNFYRQQTRRNLHVVFCTSPVGSAFRSRALRFPALVNCATIDWFMPWPKDALLSVGRRFLGTVQDLGEDDVRAAVEHFLPFAFERVSAEAASFRARGGVRVHVTPKSFLEFVRLYIHLLQEKRDYLTNAVGRLDRGVKRLASTGEEVARIESEIKDLLENAEEAKEAADQIAEQVA